MSRSSRLLAVLTDEPVSTSRLYDRVGYTTLVSMGLVPYEAFRAELAKLVTAGLAQSGVDEDGATTWQLPGPPEDGSPGHSDGDGGR
jgi:hypothetical protein